MLANIQKKTQTKALKCLQANPKIFKLSMMTAMVKSHWFINTCLNSRQTACLISSYLTRVGSFNS